MKCTIPACVLDRHEGDTHIGGNGVPFDEPTPRRGVIAQVLDFLKAS